MYSFSYVLLPKTPKPQLFSLYIYKRNVNDAKRC